MNDKKNIDEDEDDYDWISCDDLNTVIYYDEYPFEKGTPGKGTLRRLRKKSEIPIRSVRKPSGK